MGKIKANLLVGGFLFAMTTSSQAKEPHLEHHAPIGRHLKSTQTYIHDLKGRCFEKAEAKVDPFNGSRSVSCSVHFTTKDYSSFYEGYPPPIISAGTVTSYLVLDEAGAYPGMNAYGGAKFSLSKFGIISRIKYVTTADVYEHLEDGGRRTIDTDPASIEKGYYALKDAKGNYWAAYKFHIGIKSKWYVGSKIKNYWLHCKPTDTFSREYGCYGKLKKHNYKTRDGIKSYYYDKNNNRKIYPLRNKPILMQKEPGPCIKNGIRVRC